MPGGCTYPKIFLWHQLYLINPNSCYGARARPPRIYRALSKYTKTHFFVVFCCNLPKNRLKKWVQKFLPLFWKSGALSCMLLNRQQKQQYTTHRQQQHIIHDWENCEFFRKKFEKNQCLRRSGLIRPLSTARGNIFEICCYLCHKLGYEVSEQ